MFSSSVKRPARAKLSFGGVVLWGAIAAPLFLSGDAMQIKLYQTDDAANVINKTLANQRVIDVALRRDFDLHAPELTLRMANAAEALGYNYAVMPDLGRRYFIDNVENVGANRWRYRLAVDVMETYKADILAGDHAYQQAVGAGDYGTLNLDETGRVDVATIEGDVALAPAENSIVSITTWSY